MKLSTALLLLALGASDAARAGTRRRAQDSDDAIGGGVEVIPTDEQIEADKKKAQETGEFKKDKYCVPTLFSGVYNYLAPFGVAYQITMATGRPDDEGFYEGVFSVSAAGLSGPVTDGNSTLPSAAETDNGYVEFNSDDFFVDEDTKECVFISAGNLTCGLAEGSCGYGVETRYVDGNSLWLQFTGYTPRLAAKA